MNYFYSIYNRILQKIVVSKNKITKDFKHLTESVIARAAIPFLKSYYKYRAHLMENDLEAGVSFNIEYGKRIDNITIDGLLSYKQKNGGLFSVAVEATSRDKREEEVFFKVQYTLLNFDATAVSITLVTILFSILYISELINLRLLGWIIPIMFIIFFISVFILIYRWLFTYVFPFVDRYHYIQAVEQFKQYQANEQWIAIGADVFESKNSAELIELKDQCIKSGFGLMEVTEDLAVSIIIAPARNTLLKKRQELDVVLTTEMAQRLGKNTFLRLTNAILQNKTVNNRHFNLKKILTKTSYFRKAKQLWNKGNSVEVANFRKNYYSQIIVSFLGFSIMGAILWKELSESDILQMSMQEYLTELDKIKYDLWKAPELKPEDTIDQLYVQPFVAVENDYINTPEDQPLFFLRKKEKKSFFIFQSPEPIIEKEYPLVKKNQPDGLFIISEGAIQAEYPCERVIEANKVFYAIQQSTHKTLIAAMAEIDSVSNLNLATNIFWLGCLNIKNDSFIVILDQIYDNQELATSNLISIQDVLKKEKKNTKGLKIRILLKREDD